MYCRCDQFPVPLGFLQCSSSLGFLQCSSPWIPPCSQFLDSSVPVFSSLGSSSSCLQFFLGFLMFHFSSFWDSSMFHSSSLGFLPVLDVTLGHLLGIPPCSDVTFMGFPLVLTSLSWDFPCSDVILACFWCFYTVLTSFLACFCGPYTILTSFQACFLVISHYSDVIPGMFLGDFPLF